MNRYMIYMPAGTQGRLIPCHLDGSLTLGEMETLGDVFLCAAVDGDLIGFTKPVAKTICEEFGIDMEDDAWKD